MTEYLRAEPDDDRDWAPLVGLVLILGCASITGSAIALLVYWMVSWTLEDLVKAGACCLLILGSGLIALALYRMELQSRSPRLRSTESEAGPRRLREQPRCLPAHVIGEATTAPPLTGRRALPFRVVK